MFKLQFCKCFFITVYTLQDTSLYLILFILLLYCCSHNIIIRIPHTPLYVPLVHSLCSLFILDSIYQHTNTVHLLHRCYYEHTLINVCECHHLLCLLYLVTSSSLFSFLCAHVNLLQKRDCQILQ